MGSASGVSPGGHVNEDWAVVQATDRATGQPVADGEWGSLTITTLDRDNPLLRYDLEEAIKLLPDFFAAYVNRGSAYSDKGNDDRALAEIGHGAKCSAVSRDGPGSGP